MANEIKPIGSTEISAKDAVVGNLMTDLRQIIDEARIHLASTANYELTMMYWHIGERINRDVLRKERATYGKQIIATVSRQLQTWYGSKGFEERTIRRMVQFAQEFPDWQIVSPLVSKLSWTHFLTIMTLKDPLQREFYLTMAANERWSKRTLQSKIEGSEEQIELLQLDKSGIKVAQYMTELPPRNVLVQQIQKSLEVAKAKWGNERKEDEV